MNESVFLTLKTAQTKGVFAMNTKQILEAAQLVADGKISQQECSYCGPNMVVVSDEGKLLNCPAFMAYIKSGRTDGRGCLLLHENAANRGCPFERFDKLACPK